jgi:ribonuclease-3
LGHNELLEFLGDAVLELVTTEYLYRNFSGETEGALTNVRAELVNTKSLVKIAEQLEIPRFLRVSKGESIGASLEQTRKYANAVEATVAAIYLDRGKMTAEMFVLDVIIPKLEEVRRNGTTDWKSQFQELVQGREGVTPKYRTLSETGPDHDRHFTVGCFVGTKQVAVGSGKSQKQAQMNAAKEALRTYGKE